MALRSGVRVMGQYRAYCFDGRGKVWVEDRLSAQTDLAAIEEAAAIMEAVKIELHEGNRKVTVIDRSAKR